jgi:hypothetical protein
MLETEHSFPSEYHIKQINQFLAGKASSYGVKSFRQRPNSRLFCCISFTFYRRKRIIARRCGQEDLRVLRSVYSLGTIFCTLIQVLENAMALALY